MAHLPRSSACVEWRVLTKAPVRSFHILKLYLENNFTLLSDCGFYLNDFRHIYDWFDAEFLISKRTPNHGIIAKRNYDSVCSYLLTNMGKMDRFNNDNIWLQINWGACNVGVRLIFIARTTGSHAISPLHWLLWGKWEQWAYIPWLQGAYNLWGDRWTKGNNWMMKGIHRTMP